MRQVLANLISNGLRYSPTGSAILVRCGVADGLLQIEVHDSGPGIPAEDLPHIFERFYKSTDSGGNVAHDSAGNVVHDSAGKVVHDFAGKVPHDSGGMGLGLAIARHIVLAHGGSIRAESAPGAGTTIRVDLRLSP
jgi:signal transduction histidine kinase